MHRIRMPDFGRVWKWKKRSISGWICRALLRSEYIIIFPGLKNT
jgi:hypothetical protein